MEIRGKIKSYKDVSGVSKAGKQYSKAELVIVNQDGYKDSEAIYMFTLFQKSMEAYSFNVGDEVDVHFNIECREWNERHFTNLIAWKIQAAAQTDAVHPYPAMNGDVANQFNESQGSDDIPF